MHGTADEPLLEGVDPQRRAVLVIEHGKSAWVFDPARDGRPVVADCHECGSGRQPGAGFRLQLGRAVDRPIGRRVQRSSAADRSPGAAARGGRHVLSGRSGSAGENDRRLVGRRGRAAGRLARRPGAARGPDLFGPAGGANVSPRADSRDRDHHRPEAHAAGRRLGRGAARYMVAAGRANCLGPRAGPPPGRRSARPAIGCRGAPTGARDRGPVADPGAAGAGQPGGRDHLGSGRLGTLPRSWRRVWPRCCGRCGRGRCW